jgi:hypothetical protein
MTDIIATGDKVVAAYPDTWQPLSHTESLETLEYVNNDTLKVTDTDSFYSEGELVRFNYKDGEVESVNYNGTTMWPETAWFKKQKQRKIVR